ncbi:MAG: hypothetical protein WBM07_03955 [Chitinivibrionales bacterium]
MIFLIFSTAHLFSSDISTNLNGIWVDSIYLSRLKATLSPRTAFLPLPELVAIQLNSSIKNLQFSLNFHEGLDANYDKIDKKGLLSPSDRWPNSIKTIAMQNSKLIVISIDSTVNSKQIFEKVTNDTGNTYRIFSKIIGSLTIRGKYRDSLDHKYIFKNEFVEWNGKIRKYFIEADYVEFTPLDVICFEDSAGRCNESYGYITNGNLFQMYEYNDYTKRIGKLYIELFKDQKQ